MMIEEDNEQTVLQQPRRVEVWIAFNRLLNYLVFCITMTCLPTIEYFIQDIVLETLLLAGGNRCEGLRNDAMNT